MTKEEQRHRQRQKLQLEEREQERKAAQASRRVVKGGVYLGLIDANVMKISMQTKDSQEDGTVIAHSIEIRALMEDDNLEKDLGKKDFSLLWTIFFFPFD